MIQERTHRLFFIASDVNPNKLPSVQTMKMLITRFILCVVLGTMCMARVLAQRVDSERRTALIIGVGAYDDTYFSPLQSPKVDAEKMERQLRALGFEVEILKNTKRRQMVEAIDSFGDKLSKQGGVGLFYYSGHGVQFDQQNYMVPLNTDIKTTRDLPDEAVAVQRVLNRMTDAKNRLNLVFLDACRNNAIPTDTKSGGGGLASMRGGSGMMVFFATQPGQVAFDSSEGTGSVFTTSLLKHLNTTGVSFMDMMADVTADTETLSQKISDGREKQTPFISGSLSGRFYFAPEGGITLPLPPELRTQSSADSLPKSELTKDHENGDIFHVQPYAGYNAYTKEIITRRLQGKLNATGYFLGAIDGNPGLEVRQALIEYQRTYNLPPTGELDLITLRSLKLEGIAEQKALIGAATQPKIVKRDPEPEVPRRSAPRPSSDSQSSGDLDAKFRRAAEAFEKK